MRILFWIGIGLVSFAVLVILGVIVYALPATLNLPSGPRPGIEDLTLEKATTRLGQSEAKGWDLIEDARLLVGERMVYSRRNSFDSYRKAFWRGYGYCQQQAYALTEILLQLGFDAWPVHSEHNDFPERKDTGHAWVQVSFQGEIRDIDPVYMDPVTGKLTFYSRTPARKYTAFFRIFSGWGCLAGNAYRYYRTGSDTSSAY